MPKFKSKIEKVDGSSDSNQNSENEASGLNSSEEDVDFDRPTIKPPDPEGANKRKKDAKRDRGRRKRNLTPERGLQKASKFDYKREKLKRYAEILILYHLTEIVSYLDWRTNLLAIYLSIVLLYI